MKMFDKFGKGPKDEPENNSEWDNLGQAEPFQAPETEPVNNDAARQQRKIITGVLCGVDRALSYHDFNVTVEHEQMALEHLANKDFRESFERDFLKNIAGPLDLAEGDPQKIFENSFAGHKHESRILAHMTGLGFDGYDVVRPVSINVFLGKYPLPMDFENASNDFLEVIKRSNSAEKYAEYQRDMENFKHAVYGKRQEYWEQMKALNEKVSAIVGADTEARTEPSTRPHAHPNGGGPNPPDESLDQAAELDSMLKRATIDGNEVVINGETCKLTPEMLEQAGLKPEYLVQVGDRKIGLSGLFKIRNRDCAIGYVENDDGSVKVRSYYQSGSQGVWRYLPDYVCDEHGIGYYGKAGFYNSEERLTLPWQLQQKLGEIAMSETGRRDESVYQSPNPWFLFAGTAYAYPSDKNLESAYLNHTAAGDFYRETAELPNIDFPLLGGDVMTPQALQIDNPNEEPNFKKEIASFILPSKEYGNIRMRVYESLDGRAEYMFGENGEGAWLTSLQTKDKVGSTGCKVSWASAGDIGMPLHEYGIQSKGYGEQVPGSKYYSMWKNFISKIPLIQKYLNRNM